MVPGEVSCMENLAASNYGELSCAEELNKLLQISIKNYCHVDLFKSQKKTTKILNVLHFYTKLAWYFFDFKDKISPRK